MMAGHLMLLVFIVGGEYLLLLVHGGVPLKGAGVPSFAFSILMTAFELLDGEFLQAFIFTHAGPRLRRRGREHLH